jgi:hypothetical protein
MRAAWVMNPDPLKRRKYLQWTLSLYVPADELLTIETLPAVPKAVWSSLQYPSGPACFLLCISMTQLIDNKTDTNITSTADSRWHANSYR